MQTTLQNEPFKLDIRVYYEDTDTGGVVYYANYLKFFERARTEFLRSLGMNQQELADSQKIMFVVKQANIVYSQAARLDDLIEILTIVTEMRASSIYFEQQALRNNELLAKASVQICTVHATRFKPVRIPLTTRQLIQKAIN